MYCERCGCVTEEERCPVCGNADLRPPESDDACFLKETTSMWAGMLKDVLDQNGITCMEKSTLGAGLAVRTGAMFEMVRCYVRYEDLEKAREIERELFPENGEAAEEIEEPEDGGTGEAE